MKTIILIGALTWYAGPYVGQPLRCGGTYTTDHAWVAVDLDAYDWQCGDSILVRVDGQEVTLPALDSGPLSLYYVGTVPIVGDLPEHVYRGLGLDGLSVAGSIVNLSALQRYREMQRLRWME